MWVEPSLVGQQDAVLSAAQKLDPVASDLLDCIRLAVAPGDPVPDRFRRDIESDGEDLWRLGALVPRVRPSEGGTLDPRYYAGMCRLNDVFAGVPLWPELQEAHPYTAHPPPSHLRADAIIVAAVLEMAPLRLTQAGVMRRDDHRRFLSSMGEDLGRWSLALAWAQAAGLVRSAGPVLSGYPESKPRPISEPLLLLGEAGVQTAGALLLRVAGTGWVDLGQLSEELEARCPEVLAAKTRPRTRWSRREWKWLQSAAAGLHRMGLLEAHLNANGVVGFRASSPWTPGDGGFLLTPDRDILVDPREVSERMYGRLCRAAPYVDGDVMHRHRLTQDGVTADLANGYDDLLEWLERWSRTGVPANVATGIRDWQRSAVRIRLFTGVSVLEDPTRAEDRFTILNGPAPAEARQLQYRGGPPARFEVVEGVIRVPFGEDALTVRVLADRIGMPVDPGPLGWRWEIAPEALDDPADFLNTLRRFHEGPLPGELEAAVLGATGTLTARSEACTMLVLPEAAADALCRDRVAGPLLTRRLDARTCVVLACDIHVLRQRLEWLGFGWQVGPDNEDASDPDTAPIDVLAP